MIFFINLNNEIIKDIIISIFLIKKLIKILSKFTNEKLQISLD